jgi:peptide/nickel transport system substrate-binding protein
MHPQKRFYVLLAFALIASMLFTACQSAAPVAEAPATEAPAAEAPPAAAPAVEEAPATEAPAAEAPAVEEPVAEAPAMIDKYGGILRHAAYAVTVLDPTFLTSVPDDEAARQWHDFLIFIGEDNTADASRSIAESWEYSEDGLTWTFNLRQGVLFHDGREMTSKDVKFTFDRLRDPEIGSATVDLYSNIVDITAPDDYTVVFTLTNPNPDFLKDIGDYHALIMDSNGKDFATEWNGTGPFILKSYTPEDRIIFERNPNYWMKDADGNQLPYLDGMEFIFMGDTTAQVEALRGGQIDYLIYVPSEYVAVLEGDNIPIYQSPSNTAYILHMRADRGPAQDNRVRQAFKLATDTESILQGAFQGLGVAGSGTPFGPIYGDFYLDEPLPARDVEKAKALLAEAGFPDGLTIEMTCQEPSPVPAICTIWKEQLAEAGVTVNINIVPADVYYGADNLWLEADFAVTDWGSRPYPQPYLDLAYTCTAKWNEAHWCDEEFDALSAQAAMELDPEKRIELYHQIQRILNERGAVIVPFFVNNLWAAAANLKGVVPTMGLGTSLDLRQVYFEK